MSKLIQEAIGATNFCRTENFMVTQKTSLCPTVDLFFKIGCRMPKEDFEGLLMLLEEAFLFNNDHTTRILLWSRDILQGAGIRQNFRGGLLFLQKRGHISSDACIALLNSAIHSGIAYWKDLILIYPHLDPKSRKLALWLMSLATDTLIFKWLPRKGLLFNHLSKELKMGVKNLRKRLVENSSTVEQLIGAGKYSEIDYSKIPSLASRRYANLFLRKDRARYSTYLNAVKSGAATMHAAAIWPHEIIRDGVNSIFLDIDKSEINWEQMDAQWKCLPNFLKDAPPNYYLPIIDNSGSMLSLNALPMQVACALGIYISERNVGRFHNEFVSFSGNPQFHSFQDGLGLKHKLSKMAEYAEISNTNIERTFQVLLAVALTNNIPEKEMPKCLLIISDMQFDACTADYDETVLNMMKRLYSEVGYDLPKIVFWSVRHATGIPVTFDQFGTALVSGYSPAIMKSIISAEELTPYKVMYNTIMQERYDYPKELEIKKEKE